MPQSPGAGWDEYEKITPEFACQLTMSGPVGISGNFIDLLPEQLSVFKSYIAFYKKYRDFFRDSVIYLGAEPNNVGDRKGFYHLQYSHKDTGDQLVFVYRFITSADRYYLYLRDLDESGMYEVEDALSGTKICEYSGAELMKQGAAILLETRHSGQVLYFRKMII